MYLLFRVIPRLSGRLSGKNPLITAWTLFVLWYFAITRKIFKFKNDLPVTFVWCGKTFKIFLRTNADIAVLREIFLDQEYAWCPFESPRIIIDMGAHFGDTAIYYACRFPGATIYALEPSPENYERLIKHTINFKNIIPIQVAIGPTDTVVQFNLTGSSLGHSVAKRASTIETIAVKQVSLPTLYKNYGIKLADLIKFDIEGGEFDLLSQIKVKDFAKACIGEVHFDLDHRFTFDNLGMLFEGCDFEFDKIGNHRGLVRVISK
jgi:FkbM family methyltransferase